MFSPSSAMLSVDVASDGARSMVFISAKRSAPVQLETPTSNHGSCRGNADAMYSPTVRENSADISELFTGYSSQPETTSWALAAATSESSIVISSAAEAIDSSSLVLSLADASSISLFAK